MISHNISLMRIKEIYTAPLVDIYAVLTEGVMSQSYDETEQTEILRPDWEKVNL